MQNYQTASNVEALWFAKLAIIELCGWIEESMDDLIRTHSTNHLTQVNVAWCEREIIKKTHGFDYADHFRHMLARLVGIVSVEKLEGQVNANLHAQMLAALTYMRPFRNSEAHTHIKGTPAIDSPSVTRAKFKLVYDGLVEVERIMALL